MMCDYGESLFYYLYYEQLMSKIHLLDLIADAILMGLNCNQQCISFIYTIHCHCDDLAYRKTPQSGLLKNHVFKEKALITGCIYKMTRSMISHAHLLYFVLHTT